MVSQLIIEDGHVDAAWVVGLMLYDRHFMLSFDQCSSRLVWTSQHMRCA